MKLMANINKSKFKQILGTFYIPVLFTIIPVFFLSACNELQKPKTDTFYSQTAPPPKQEFRWSNGKMPKSFDPAQAASAPETDFVRALYEGLTDTDSQTLQPVPAIAVKWSASEDFKTWTFILRRDAKWSNGEAVTAKDFVRSWKRLIELGDKVPQRQLLKNIIGMDTANVLPVFADEEIDIPSKTGSENSFLSEKKQANQRHESSEKKSPAPKEKAVVAEQKTEPPPPIKKDLFGVEAVNDFTLKVSLTQPDKNLPSLVAHPIFRPIYGDGKDFAGGVLSPDIITNGAFQIVEIGQEGVTLDRADYFWNAAQIELERVRFIPSENAETALAAYREGTIDAVTNATFQPLALKLLAPYDDFRQAIHSALNFYEFNSNKPQFNDARVRKALAMAIERERLTEDEMDGASQPALKFSPFDGADNLSQSVSKAQKLLTDAGFPNGQNFPTIRLLINRNDMQTRIARAVKKMWKKNLNVETEIVIKDGTDFETAVQNGDYDILRRGIVLPTTDETANMLMLFPPPNPQPIQPVEKAETAAHLPETAIVTLAANQALTEAPLDSNSNLSANMNGAEQKKEAAPTPSPTAAPLLVATNPAPPILSEAQALESLPAIPIYFPTSYSLVKPYVQGFEINALDAPSLKNVKINNDWQPANQKILSNSKN